MKTIQTVTFDRSDSYHMSILRQYVRELGERSEQVSENYRSPRWIEDDHLCFTLWLEDQKPMGLSTVYLRDWYQQHGTVRILNRLYKERAFRCYGRSSHRISEPMAKMLLQQIDWIQTKATTAIRYIFISRHTKKFAHNQLLCYWLSKNTNLNWLYPGNTTQFLVCPNEQDNLCWQWIVYSPLTSIKTIPFKSREVLQASRSDLESEMSPNERNTLSHGIQHK